MSSRFGADFSGVRAHRGPEASAACVQLRAEAFAYGDRIAFRDQEPSKHTVAHELAHTIQQGAVAGVQMQRAGGSGSALEQEADAAADAVVSGAPVGGLTRVTSPALMRKEAPGSSGSDGDGSPGGGDAADPAELDRALAELEGVSPDTGLGAGGAQAPAAEEDTDEEGADGGAGSGGPAAGDQVEEGCDGDFAELEQELAKPPPETVDKGADDVAGRAGSEGQEGGKTEVVQAKLDPDSPRVGKLLRRARLAKLIRVSIIRATWTFIAKYRVVRNARQLKKRRYRNWIRDYVSIRNRGRNAAERLYLRHTAAKVLARLARLNIDDKTKDIHKTANKATQSAGMSYSRLGVQISTQRNLVAKQIRKMRAGNVEMLSQLSAGIYKYLPRLRASWAIPATYLKVLREFLFELKLREGRASGRISDEKLAQIQNQLGDIKLMELLDKGQGIPPQLRSRAAEFRAWKKKSYLQFQFYGRILKNNGFTFQSSWRNPVVTTVGKGERNPEIHKVSFDAIISTMRSLVASQNLQELDPRKFAKSVAEDGISTSKLDTADIKLLKSYAAGMNSAQDRYLVGGASTIHALIRQATFKPADHTKHLIPEIRFYHQAAIVGAKNKTAAKKNFVKNIMILFKSIARDRWDVKKRENDGNTELSPVVRWIAKQEADHPNGVYGCLRSRPFT